MAALRKQCNDSATSEDIEKRAREMQATMNEYGKFVEVHRNRNLRYGISEAKFKVFKAKVRDER